MQTVADNTPKATKPATAADPIAKLPKVVTVVDNGREPAMAMKPADDDSSKETEVNNRERRKWSLLISEYDKSLLYL